MPLDTVCKVHTVTRLVQTVAAGKQMGVSRSWGPETPPVRIACHVYPGTPEIRVAEGVRITVIPHTIYTIGNPSIDERYRLQWTDPAALSLVLRIVSQGKAPGGFGTLWVIHSEARSDDNQPPAQLR